MKRWFRWAAVCLLALALLAACALAETREEKYTQDGWDYCDSYEDDTLVQRTRTQALEDGTRCEERYNLVAGKLTLVRKNLLDADGNRLSGSVAYNYDYNTGDYQGRGECAGLDEEGREVWKEYDDADVFTGEVKQWQDEDGRFYVAQYDADGKLYARHAREWLEDGGCNETSEALVAGELKVVSKDIYDADGNRLAGSIDYHYDDATGAYQGRTVYRGVDGNGHENWTTYDKNDLYEYRRESWGTDQNHHYDDYYDANGIMIKKYATIVQSNGTNRVQYSQRINGSLRLMSDIYCDDDGNVLPRSVNYIRDDQTGECLLKMTYAGRNEQGRDAWELRTTDNYYVGKTLNWEDRRGLHQEIVDENGKVIARYLNGVELKGKPKSVVLSPSGKQQLMLGEKLQLDYSFKPANAYSEIKWSSSNKAVATVSEDGLVTALADGNAVITAKASNGGAKATVTITVIDPAKPTGITLEAGKTARLALQDTLKLNYTLLPEGTAESDVKFTTSDKRIATVSADGVVTPLKEGKVTITATTAKNSRIKAAIAITVFDPKKPTGITLEAGKTARLALQDTLKLNYTLLPEGTAESDVKFTTSDKRIATVSADGVVTPLKEGKVTITATTAKNSRIKAAIAITVFDPKKPTGITLEAGKTARLALQDTLQLNYTLLPETAESDVKFTTSDKRIATVSADGVVTPLKEGKVTITATTAKNSRIKATITITVFDPKKPTGITLEAGKTAQLALQDTLQLNYTLLPETAESDVKFTTSNKSIATVSADGVVTPLKEGKVTITATTAKNSRIKATIAITVFDPKKPTGVQFVQSGTVKVNLGETLQLEYGLLPETAESEVKFTTSDKRIATVSADGVVTPLKEGKAKITVTTTKNKNAKATITVQVVDPTKATGVAFVDAERTVTVGESFTLEYRLEPVTATTKATLSSSNSAIVKVNADGTLSALKEGKATITVKTANKLSAKVVVTVVPVPVIEPEEPQLPTEGEDVPPTEPEQKDEEQPKADENPEEQPEDEEQPKADENPEEQPKDEEQPKADENPGEQPKDEEQPKADENPEEQPKAEEQPAEEKSEQAE